MTEKKMKYVRTKDGKIIEMTEKGCIREFNDKLYAFADSAYSYRFENGWEITNQADTIEKLCDDFLVEYTNGEHVIFHYFYHLQRHHDLYGQDYHHVAGRYGCIWVAGKGLKYVAEYVDGGWKLL